MAMLNNQMVYIYIFMYIIVYLTGLYKITYPASSSNIISSLKYILILLVGYIWVVYKMGLSPLKGRLCLP